MILPEDLKNRNFSRTVRGYNPIEVDDYIKFLLSKYEQLHRENADLEKRLHIVSGKYEELAADEETIRNAVGQARKLCDSMLLSAEKSANTIIDKVKARCDDIIEDAQIKVEGEEKKLANLRMQAAQFKAMLIGEYTQYLKTLRSTEIPSPDEVKEEFPTHDFIRDTALENLDAEEIIEVATLAPTKEPELEEFKRFVRPAHKKLTREEKAALKQAKKEGKASNGLLTETILQSAVDDEDPAEDIPEEALLAESPEMSVKEAMAHSPSNEEDNTPDTAAAATDSKDEL